MQSTMRKTLTATAVGLSLFTGACASNDELMRLQADTQAAAQLAQQALTAAQAAQQRADAAAQRADQAAQQAQAANTAAQNAQGAADRAAAAAQNANSAIQSDRAERARTPPPRGARGERG